MQFASIRVITSDVKRLTGFYEQATGQSATWRTDDFAEVTTPSCTLAIASTRTVAPLGANAPVPASNGSVIIEFRVDDVDREYENLKRLTADFVLTPTTMPWGNRSVLFRDPDGNLVNFFAPVTVDARARHEH